MIISSPGLLTVLVIYFLCFREAESVPDIENDLQSDRSSLSSVGRNQNIICDVTHVFRLITGQCTNPFRSNYASAGIPFESRKGNLDSKVFVEGPQYPDPRKVSNEIGHQYASIKTRNRRNLSSFLVFFGQFLDHCFARTKDNGARKDIEIDRSDPHLMPTTIPFHRSERGSFLSSLERPVNNLSSLIDLTAVYGVDKKRLEFLRDNRRIGRMKVSENDLLPLNENSLENFPFDHETSAGKKKFIAGDVRSNEHHILTAFHILFLREHNRIADELLKNESLCSSLPSWQCNEKIFNLARRFNGMQFQKVVFEEFFPALTNQQLVYNGFDYNVDATLSVVFSTAAFRFGHTLVPEFVERRDKNRALVAKENIWITFNTESSLFTYNHNMFDSLLRGTLYNVAEEMDTSVVNSLRNFLFRNIDDDSITKVDLLAINIQRSRDHNVPFFNELRTLYRLPTLSSFNQLTSDFLIAGKLQNLYGTVDNLDAFVGLLAENKVSGTSFGQTMLSIWTDEFTRLSHGDYFFYKNEVTIPDEILAFSEYNDFLTNKNLMQTILTRNSRIKDSEIDSSVWFTSEPAKQKSHDFAENVFICEEVSESYPISNGYKWKYPFVALTMSKSDLGNTTTIAFKCNSCPQRPRPAIQLNNVGVTLETVKSNCIFAGIRRDDRTKPLYDCSLSYLQEIIEPSLTYCEDSLPPVTPTPKPTETPAECRDLIAKCSIDCCAECNKAL